MTKHVSNPPPPVAQKPPHQQQRAKREGNMNNNGNLPAYPEHHVFEDCGIDGSSGPHLVQTVKSGLTKREQFAMAAMQGLLVNMGRNGIDSVKQVAEHAICAADALLAELECTK